MAWKDVAEKALDGGSNKERTNFWPVMDGEVDVWQVGLNDRSIPRKKKNLFLILFYFKCISALGAIISWVSYTIFNVLHGDINNNICATQKSI